MDHESFKEIYIRYSPLVWFVIGKSGVPERDREDTFMETWEAILASMDSFSGRSSLATWIGKIARNKAVDRVRRPVTVPLEEDGLIQPEGTARGVSPNPGRAAVRREAGELLARFLKVLPRERRLVVEQWLEGLSYQEIARRCGRPGDTNYVGKEIFLAKRRLAGMLEAAGISSLENIWE